MNGVIVRRLFMAGVVACTLVFMLASGVLSRGFGDLEFALSDADQAPASIVNSQTAASVHSNAGASANKALIAVDGNIATSRADLAQATADMQEANDK